MHLLTIFTAITLTSTVAFAGTIQRRSFDTGVAGSHVNTQANKGLNNGQANGNKGIVKGSYTVVQASQSCGNSQLNCCSNVEQGDDSSTGVVAATLGIAGKVFVDCSPVSLREFSDSLCLRAFSRC